MLIGIMRRSTEKKGCLSTFDYECTLLQQGDTLISTGVKSDRGRLFSELIVFKEEFDENEQYLVSICYIILYISIKNFILVI